MRRYLIFDIRTGRAVGSHSCSDDLELTLDHLDGVVDADDVGNVGILEIDPATEPPDGPLRVDPQTMEVAPGEEDLPRGGSGVGSPGEVLDRRTITFRAG